MKTLLTLTSALLALAISTTATASKDECLAFVSDTIPKLEVQLALSSDCKIDFQVYGKDAADKESCILLDNYIKSQVNDDSLNKFETACDRDTFNALFKTHSSLLLKSTRTRNKHNQNLKFILEYISI